MRKSACIILFIISGLSVHGQETIVPETLPTASIADAPFSFNGLLSVGFGSGSASIVSEGVLVTAAHVIFDDESLTWEPINSIRYFPRYHKTTPFQPSGTQYQPIAFIRWTSYSTRVENDESGPGLSTPDTFNFDFAAGYLNKSIIDNKILRYPEVAVDAENEVGILRDRRTKIMVGYPTDSEFVSSSNRGLMHATDPADYFCWWGGLEEIPSSWRDSENYWVATYDFEGVTTYGGNSGGPIYVVDDEGHWTMAGIVVGSNGSDGVLARGMDENSWKLVEAASIARGGSTVYRVQELSASSAGPTSIALQWVDRSEGEAGYEIHRLNAGIWEYLTVVPGNTTEYTDTTVMPGHVYQYQVQTVDNNDMRLPKSPAVKVATTGTNTVAAEYLGQPQLTFLNSGDSNWHVDVSNKLRAGKVRSLGTSILEMPIIGPGLLSFSWSVSSEENPDYANPLNQNFGEIYDALFLYMDDQLVLSGTEPVFLSGLDNSMSLQVEIPEGAHTIKWAYEKDPYTDQGVDTGFLEALSWTPGPASPYPVWGAFAYEGTPWRGSAWLGVFEASAFPWVGHLQFGWLYLRPGNGNDLYFYSPHPELGDLFTSPSFFPYVYHYQRNQWLYYVEGTGSFGTGIWFYDLNIADYFRID